MNFVEVWICEEIIAYYTPPPSHQRNVLCPSLSEDSSILTPFCLPDVFHNQECIQHDIFWEVYRVTVFQITAFESLQNCFSID